MKWLHRLYNENYLLNKLYFICQRAGSMGMEWWNESWILTGYSSREEGSELSTALLLEKGLKAL